MPWARAPAGGSPHRARPWLPMADPAACNVADQEGDPDSALELCRRAIAARRRATTWPSGPTGRSAPRGHLGLRAGRGHDGAAQHVGRTGDLRRRARHGDGGHRPALEGSSMEGALDPAGVERRRRGDVTGDAAPGRAALRAVHDPGPGPHGAVAGAGAPAGRRRARGRVLHHGHYRRQVEATGAAFVPFAEAYDSHDLMVANPERESSSNRGVRGSRTTCAGSSSGRSPASTATCAPSSTASPPTASSSTPCSSARCPSPSGPARRPAGAGLHRRDALRLEQPRRGAVRRRRSSPAAARCTGCATWP